MYSGPKTSFGGNAGFEARYGGKTVKVKFAETTSEPFTSRIFAALGYNVAPTDHARFLKIRYDRRLVREFHLRRPVNTRIHGLALFSLYSIDLQKRFDPFAYIQWGVLKDGSKLNGWELKTRLFNNSDKAHPEDSLDNFNEAFEAELEYLVTVPANVQVKDESARTIGSWDLNQLDHPDRRELRGVGLLGAWVGWFDSRFDNMRLKVIPGENGPRLVHFFSDLGGGLGKATGPVSRSCEGPNLFHWTFTRPPVVQGKGKMTRPFRIIHYQPIEDTEPFRRMTIEDARWMARKISQLTESQIVQS
jgi:hypothetical protein